MIQQKYLKYREKYLNLKNELSGGVGLGDIPSELLPKIVSDNSITCRQTMNTAKTSKAFANAIDFANLTNSITTNIPNINRRTSGICNQIDDVVRRAQCNEYNNKCYIFELFVKYCNIFYQGQVLAAPVAPATYDLNTLNEILLRTIPNNIEDPDKVEDQQNLIRFGADIRTIGHRAFYSNQLVQIVIPNTITHIGLRAFYLNQLFEVIIPNSVIQINRLAFSQNELVQIRIPDSVITIGDNAFSENQLIKVIIGNSVRTISKGAFYENQLVQIRIPESVITIGELAFYDNPLEQVTIPGRFIHRLEEIFGPNYENINFTYT